VIAKDASDPWMRFMRCGDFEAAWQISDRHLCPRGPEESRKPRHLQRIWDGRPLNGQHVLIRCYHGLGDSIQFLRYVPLAAAVAREVSLWIQAPLVKLVEPTPGLTQVRPLHDGDPGIEYDVDVESMELSQVFRTTVETIPSRVPYLQLPGGLPRLQPGRPRIGLAWRAGSWDPRRSMPVHVAARMVEAAGCDVTVLQNDLGPEDLTWFSPSGCSTISELAACLASLDLVITVDTVFAHLAGALGRPTWVLLQADADWRWMVNRDDSPWYPTARLYRQSVQGDWVSLAARVARDLKSCFGRR